MREKKRVVCVVGPTACGKTALGVSLARRFHGEVVSADSMQVYRGMEIGTAAPTMEERRGIVHHMIGIADPHENYSVARYVSEAGVCVDDVLARGKLPIIVGGTGLYVDALVAGRTFASGKHGDAMRLHLKERQSKEGLETLYRELRRIDYAASERIHPNDEKRILRALEIYYTTGETITHHDAMTRRTTPKYDAVFVGLNFEERETLYQTINARVDRMMELGLLEEVRCLSESGVGADTTAMAAIGYKELLPVLYGGRDMKEAAEEIKKRSRQYAKRQLTWFRRNNTIVWFPWKKTRNFSHVLQASTEFLMENGLG